MSGSDLARSFLESVSGYVDDPGGAPASQDRPVKLGTVDPAYAGTGKARVKFDGESIMGQRTYVALMPVKAGDRVALLPVGRTFVVLGSLAGLVLPALTAADIPNLPASKITSGTLPTTRGGTGVAAANLDALKAALGIPASARGVATSAAGTYLSVTFPAGRFTAPPSVVVTPYANANVAVPHIGSITATGFTYQLFTISGGVYAGTASWQAEQS